MTDYFSHAVEFFAEALVSVRRLEKFMKYQEVGGKDANSIEPINHQKQSTACLHMKNVKAKWNSHSSDYTLDDVTLEVKPGTIALVTGLVGSGKSSLLQVILGELPIESGELVVNGKVSYASQEPWIFSGSVRQNILFGTPMDSARYETVLMKCALVRDFELWPGGDRTIVGERGVMLSGGQKARISLARAIYREADIYLLDDPLSAVDPRVSTF
jgi:ATP-binding cassette subfamily C (CFTR/MRP) protein 4